MVGLLNLGSLILGIVAWILPIVNLIQFKHSWVGRSMMSISACAISLGFQIFYMYHLVKIKDWSALMDTMGAVAFAAAVLLIVTIGLNVMTLMVYRKREKTM